jgi:Zn-dependent peptidase ImmA (M78 family)
LLEVTDAFDYPVPSEIVTEQPHIRIEYRDMPTSGLSYWSRDTWIICLNRTEPYTRQRFTLLHEFKHIVDHHSNARPRAAESPGTALAEHVADYFAGCVLAPKRLLKRAWGDGIQRPVDLGRLFDVSARAITVRLSQVGLTGGTSRCAPDTVIEPPIARGTAHRHFSNCIPDLILEAHHEHAD